MNGDRKLRVFLTGSTSFLGTKFTDLYSGRFDILGVARSDHAHAIDLLDFDRVNEVYMDFRPDVILHAAADLGRDSTATAKIVETNPNITRNLLTLAKRNSAAVIFTSTESVYGGKEEIGGYIEGDEYEPRSAYGQSKALSEQAILESDLPYLITRGHRYIGVSPRFTKSKQFLNTIRNLLAGEAVHLDSRKLFKPVLIDTLCDVLAHHILRNRSQKVLINVGVDRATTYYELVHQIALIAGIDTDLVQPDGEEAGWLLNSTLSLEKARGLGYPEISWDAMLAKISEDLPLVPN